MIGAGAEIQIWVAQHEDGVAMGSRTSASPCLAPSQKRATTAIEFWDSAILTLASDFRDNLTNSWEVCGDVGGEHPALRLSRADALACLPWFRSAAYFEVLS